MTAKTACLGHFNRSVGLLNSTLSKRPTRDCFDSDWRVVLELPVGCFGTRPFWANPIWPLTNWYKTHIPLIHMPSCPNLPRLDSYQYTLDKLSTDHLFEVSTFIGSHGVCFGYQWNDVHFVVKLFHHLYVQWLQSVQQNTHHAAA